MTVTTNWCNHVTYRKSQNNSAKETKVFSVTGMKGNSHSNEHKISSQKLEELVKTEIFLEGCAELPMHKPALFFETTITSTQTSGKLLPQTLHLHPGMNGDNRFFTALPFTRIPHLYLNCIFFNKVPSGVI